MIDIDVGNKIIKFTKYVKFKTVEKDNHNKTAKNIILGEYIFLLFITISGKIYKNLNESFNFHLFTRGTKISLWKISATRSQLILISWKFFGSPFQDDDLNLYRIN